MHTTPVHSDDIYIETSSALNLSNPVPEPTTWSVLAVGAVVLLWRRLWASVTYGAVSLRAWLAS